MDPFEPSLFRMFYNLTGTNGLSKSPDFVHHVNVTLEEIFSGTTRLASITRTVVCNICAGTGSRSGVPSQCRSCAGQGCRITTRLKFGASFAETCDVCYGTGRIITARDRCHGCKGTKKKAESKEIPIHIHPGVTDLQEITFINEGNQLCADEEPGNLRIVLHQLDHSKFKRSGNNLILEHELSLTEALCGFVLSVRTLDGRELVLKSPPGKIIHPGMILGLENEGMPTERDPKVRGSLIVKFKHVFPQDNFTSPENIKLLELFLPRLNPKEELPDLTSENVEEVNLHEMTERANGSGHNSSLINSPYDDDDSPREIGCVHQ